MSPLWLQIYPSRRKTHRIVQETADTQTQTDAEGSAHAALPASDSVAAPNPG